MKRLLLSSTLALIVAQQAMANDIKVVGTIPQIVPNNAPHAFIDSEQMTHPNIVLLQKIQLSQHAKEALAARLSQIHQPKKAASFALDSSYPENLDLGMNNTPVLNQGMHGSCVTFANSGALDALIGQGDYVSELCSLTLGNYLEAKDYDYPSGWDGSWGPIVLEQFFEYGVVSMENQKSVGCGGLKEYPVWDPSKKGKAMRPSEYKELSESISDKYEWKTILETQDALSPHFNGDQVVDDVKKALNDGNRVTFGVLLDVAVGSNGAAGSYKARSDTWMLTPKIEEHYKRKQIEAGHEMIVIGYDDNAVVTDGKGNTNKGLFILRNSWGTFAGDKGNYYMTYDHFKLMTLEAQLLQEKEEN